MAVSPSKGLGLPKWERAIKQKYSSYLTSHLIQVSGIFLVYLYITCSSSSLSPSTPFSSCQSRDCLLNPLTPFPQLFALTLGLFPGRRDGPRSLTNWVAALLESIKKILYGIMKRLNISHRAGEVERVHDDVRDERREQLLMMKR